MGCISVASDLKKCVLGVVLISASRDVSLADRHCAFIHFKNGTCEQLVAVTSLSGIVFITLTRIYALHFVNC